MPLTIAVVLGSVRRDRLGARVAKFVATALAARGHAATLIDPVEYDLPLIDRKYGEYEPGTAPALMERLAGHLRAADAYAVVSAEYNHSIPPALSNLLDHFLPEYAYKPSGIVCYSAGPYGGVRAAMQLRAMLGVLGMPSVPSILSLPGAQDLLAEDGTPTGDRPGKAATKFFAEFEWYANALKTARAAGTPQ